MRCVARACWYGGPHTTYPYRHPYHSLRRVSLPANTENKNLPVGPYIGVGPIGVEFERTYSPSRSDESRNGCSGSLCIHVYQTSRWKGEEGEDLRERREEERKTGGKKERTPPPLFSTWNLGYQLCSFSFLCCQRFSLKRSLIHSVYLLLSSNPSQLYFLQIGYIRLYSSSLSFVCLFARSFSPDVILHG